MASDDRAPGLAVPSFCPASEITGINLQSPLFGCSLRRSVIFHDCAMSRDIFKESTVARSIPMGMSRDGRV